jgi:hypothetical protein
MRPQLIGRTLGIGLRVAGRVVGQRVGGAAPAPHSRASAPLSVDNASKGRAAGQAVAQGSANLGRGIAGFLRPFRRVGAIVWLEVSGVLFFLFVAALAPTLWRTRMSYAHGPDHRTFLAAAMIMAVFLYLGITSFWRARKR